MPMFKRGKPDSKEAPLEAQAVAPAAAKAHEASPAVAPAAAPVAGATGAATPTSGESLLGGVETEKVAAVPAAAIDDKTTSNLMHIFTEDQEGLNANATIYEAFMEELTMEKVAANAQQLLDDLRAAK